MERSAQQSPFSPNGAPLASLESLARTSFIRVNSCPFVVFYCIVTAKNEPKVIMNSARVLEEFERDGVVRINQFLSAAELKEVRREIENYVCDIAPNLEASEVTF